LNFYKMEQIVVHVNGTIQAAILSEGDNVFVRAHFVYGSDWTLIAGAEQILSQVAKHSSPDGAVFNMPIDVCFRTTNLHGWPRVVISIYGENGLQSMLQSRPVPIPMGHGSVLIPTIPGAHKRVLQLYRPMASKQGPLAFLLKLLRPLTGEYPDYFDSRFVGQGDSRMVTRVESTGELLIEFNIATTGVCVFIMKRYLQFCFVSWG
jgi:B9 domain-containing protein 1